METFKTIINGEVVYQHDGHRWEPVFLCDCCGMEANRGTTVRLQFSTVEGKSLHPNHWYEIHSGCIVDLLNKVSATCQT